MIKVTKGVIIKALILLLVIFGLYTMTLDKSHPVLIHQAKAEVHSVHTWRDGVLVLEVSPAMCQLHLSHAKYRQCKEKKAYTVKALDVNQSKGCHKPKKLSMSPVQAGMVNRVMPDARCQKQAWTQYGECGSQTASQYFRQIIDQTNQLTLPSMITKAKTSTVSKTSLLQSLTQRNRGLTSNAIQLSCQPYHNQSVLTHIKVCYQNGKYGSCDKLSMNKPHVSTCGNQVTLLGY